jgi:hypothetical protein
MTKNVLMVADYLKLDSWGMLAYSYLDALRQAPYVNMVARQVDFSGPKRERPEWLSSLESKTEEKYDVILQCCPPHLYNFGPNYRGIFINETTYLSNEDWARRLKLLPVIVSSEQERLVLNNRLGSAKTTLIRPYIDSSFLYNIYPLPNISAKIKDYKFYWIGEYGNRSNYQDVYRAYMAEFSSRDDVHLIMYFVENPNAQIGQAIADDLSSLKGSVGRKVFPKESIIVGNSLNEIRCLHAHYDCIIDVPHSLGYSIHVLESMYFGNNVISNFQYDSNFSTNQVFYVHSTTDVIFNSSNYDCLSLWQYPIFDYIRDKMRDSLYSKTKKKYNMDYYSLENALGGFENVI